MLILALAVVEIMLLFALVLIISPWSCVMGEVSTWKHSRCGSNRFLLDVQHRKDGEEEERRGSATRPKSNTHVVFAVIMFMFRTAAALYIANAIGYGLAFEDAGMDGRWDVTIGHKSRLPYLFYNTSWANITVLLYFVVSGMYTLVQILYLLTSDTGIRGYRVPQAIDAIVWVLAETATTAALTVSVMFWSVISQSHVEVGMYSFTAHTLVGIAAIIEAALCAYEWRLSHIAFPIGFVLTWELVSLFVHKATGAWVYDIQDRTKYAAVLTYLFYPVYALCYVVFFCILCAVNNLFTYIHSFIVKGSPPPRHISTSKTTNSRYIVV
jgi:hypothetical protein